MTSRTLVVTFVALAALIPAGCRRAAATSVPTPTVTPPATATIDYRTLTKQQLEDLIREKTGSPVTLTAAGPDKYTGTRPSPDGTVQLPVQVTVEAERVVIDTRGGGLSARDVITPRGLQAGDPR